MKLASIIVQDLPDGGYTAALCLEDLSKEQADALLSTPIGKEVFLEEQYVPATPSPKEPPTRFSALDLGDDSERG